MAQASASKLRGKSVAARQKTGRPRLRRPAASSSDREYVQGFERGVTVIKAFNAQTPQLTVTQVSEHTGLTRAVARRYLLTLEKLGYVTPSGPYYALTPRVLELGFAYLSTMTVAEVARPFMQQVVDKLRESSSVGVLDGHDVFYIARTNAARIMTTNLVVGSRLPAHATAMGHVLLAHLPHDKREQYFATVELSPLTDQTITRKEQLRAALHAVLQQGWAENDEGSEKGVRTVAVPIFDRRDEVIAAINVAVHASRATMDELRRDHLPVLQAAAASISRALGATLPLPASAVPNLSIG